jgi:hypothetical protein
MNRRGKPREEGGNDTEAGVNDAGKRRTGGGTTRRQESSRAISFHLKISFMYHIPRHNPKGGLVLPWEYINNLLKFV